MIKKKSEDVSMLQDQMRDSEMEMDSNSSPWHPNLELLGGQVLYSALNYLLSSPGTQCKH